MENSNFDKSYLNPEDNNPKEITNNEEVATSHSDNGDLKEINENNSEISSNILKSNGYTNSSNETTTNPSNTTTGKDNTKITVKSTSVVKERNLIIHLLNSENKALANKKITISFAKKTYTKTTDKNGKVSLKISLDTGKYTVKLKFAGDENYTKSNKTFNMRVYKLKTSFIIPSTSIIRGKYFYAYLKDKNGFALVSKSVTIKYNKKTYFKKTNKNGRIRLKINSKVGKYKIKLNYKGSKTYTKARKELSIKSYNAKTRIAFDKKSVVRSKYLAISIKYNKNKTLSNKKLIINFANKNYKRTTNKHGKAYFKLTKPVGTYKIKVKFDGAKGFLKSSISTKVKVLPNYTAKFSAKNKTSNLNSENTVKYYIRLTDQNGNPLAGENLTIKVKCNNFTYGSGIKITKKTIVLSSDNIDSKSKDKQRLTDMAKLLKAKGYKVIISGIGPNYHVSDVKKYKNACVFSLVGGIDSGMFVDMASNYYQNYLKKNNNQFVLGCVKSPSGINLANRTWLKRAHDDNYSFESFKGLYFPGKYLNKKARIDYVYGPSTEDLVNNFLKYAKKGKSIGMNKTLPGRYTTYTLTTNENGYIHLDLPIGNHTIISSFINKNKGYAADTITTWVNVIK
ncbi:hypothetical protein [Methanobrevibacter olleyae]|uniref:Adhesin-like protein n=1 Tax=Methanobrevibacter olleyae TaxID=294671 RepID=A0A126R006_METOL|nr:hypothetical protein [Methanobrevibacter olleyae]AMK15402.1 adhesin-like protein [Methanobrevibacter olleyae]